MGQRKQQTVHFNPSTNSGNVKNAKQTNPYLILFLRADIFFLLGPSLLKDNKRVT